MVSSLHTGLSEYIYIEITMYLLKLFKEFHNKHGNKYCVIQNITLKTVICTSENMHLCILFENYCQLKETAIYFTA